MATSMEMDLQPIQQWIEQQLEEMDYKGYRNWVVSNVSMHVGYNVEFARKQWEPDCDEPGARLIKDVTFVLKEYYFRPEYVPNLTDKTIPDFAEALAGVVIEKLIKKPQKAQGSGYTSKKTTAGEPSEASI